MLLKGDVTIHAPRKKVWDFLTDPNQIGPCAPGVEKIETIEPNKKYRGVMSVGLGSVKAKFNGDVEIIELNEPDCIAHRVIAVADNGANRHIGIRFAIIGCEIQAHESDA